MSGSHCLLFEWHVAFLLVPCITRWSLQPLHILINNTHRAWVAAGLPYFCASCWRILSWAAWMTSGVGKDSHRLWVSVTDLRIQEKKISPTTSTVRSLGICCPQGWTPESWVSHEISPMHNLNPTVQPAWCPQCSLLTYNFYDVCVCLCRCVYWWAKLADQHSLDPLSPLT